MLHSDFSFLKLDEYLKLIATDIYENNDPPPPSELIK
jgi:hypothetical protein